MAEINHRYLKDADGDRYFPMTHIDSIIGLEEMLEGNETDLSELNNKIEELTGRVEQLENGGADE